MADWNSTETLGHRGKHIVLDGNTRRAEKCGRLAKIGDRITDQLVELRMVMPHVVRGTKSTGPGAAADGEGQLGGGSHTMVPEHEWSGREEGIGSGPLRNPRRIQPTGSVDKEPVHL